MKSLQLIIALFLSFICTGQESIDTVAINKIRNEGFNHSKIEQIAFNIIDKSGGRLTNSKGFQRAADYAVRQLTDWGLINAVKEPWGEFGRGWEINKSYVAMTKPYYMPLIAIPKAWTNSTNGLVKGKVVFLDIESEEDLIKYKDKLKDVVIARKPYRKTELSFKPDAVRFTEEELKKMEDPDSDTGRHRWTPEQIKAYRERIALQQKTNTFLAKEGAALIIQGTSGKHGTLFTSSPKGYEKNAPVGIAELEMIPEHVGLMSRLIENGVNVEIEANVETTFDTLDLKGYNVVAEIPGSDSKLKSEIVMLGGHLDSWHAGTGATDNAAGCIVMMEVVRILQATGLKPKRTIRIALWSGEEQGLFGSENYVKSHFGDPKTMILKKEQESVSAYYNIDNGTGRIRGVYLQGNEKVRPIFEAWLNPFDDIIDNPTLTIKDTGGTDHLSFDAIGIPGFQFIQDPIEYSTRTHHTNMDTYERLVIDDLKQMAVIAASFVYNTAQREEKLPRKALKAVEE